MTEYKSEVKTVAAPPERVYAMLSDLTHLSAIQQNIGRPEVQSLILEKAEGKITADQLAKTAKKIQELQFTPDSVSGHISTMGDITLMIVDREPPKTIKLAVEGIPVLATMWIQLLPDGEGSAMRLVLKADLNFFIKQMVGSKIEKGLEGLATLLAQIPY